MEYTENTSMSAWKNEYARIIPYAIGNFSSLNLVSPIGLDKDDDLIDGNETKEKYEALGSNAFITYRDYACTRNRD